MSNPAFIVDGYTEKKIVQHICPGQPVRRTDLNGKSVSISAICKKIASFIRLLGNRHYPIIILVDKEQRDISFLDMAEEIHNGLRLQGIKNIDIRVGVADRMIENWILSDWEMLKGDVEGKPQNSDQSNGAAIIRKVKNTYDKTTDGVEYFINSRPEIMYQNSVSYRHFIDSLAGIDCNYITFR